MPEMNSKEIAETLAAMAPLVSEHGAEKAGRVIECLTDIHTALLKYDDEVRHIAIGFVIREASK
jgi:hypothetical protein